MSVLTTIAQAEGGHEVVNDLWMPAPMFGVAFLLFLAVFVVITWSFRNVANRHAEKAERYAREHGGDGGEHKH